MTPSRRSHAPETAVFKPTRWPGLIWAVPVAALAVVAWLGLRDWLARGPRVTVEFPVVAGLQPGDTKIEYQGFVVGQVGSVWFSRGLDHMFAELQFKSTMTGHLGPGTRYWIAGRSANLAEVSSLIAAVSGPFIGVDPKPGSTAAQAKGVADENAPGPDAAHYQVVFDGGPKGLRRWAPVQLEGAQIGAVTSVQTRYDGGQGKLKTTVDLAIDPRTLGLAGPPSLQRMLAALIHQGMRAELASSAPILGGKIVNLALVPGAPPASLNPGDPPRIPTHEAADLAQVMQQVQELLAQAKSAVGQAQTALDRQASANPAPNTSDLPHALYEVQRAASSLRQLTDYLNQHPNALITGRKP